MSLHEATQISLAVAGQKKTYETSVRYAQWGRGDIFRMMLKKLGVFDITSPDLIIKKVVIERENGWFSASAHNEPFHCEVISEKILSPTELFTEYPKLKGRI